MAWLIKRLVKVGANVAYRGRGANVDIASTFPLPWNYGAVYIYSSGVRQRSWLTEGRVQRYALQAKRNGPARRGMWNWAFAETHERRSGVLFGSFELRSTDQ